MAECVDTECRSPSGVRFQQSPFIERRSSGVEDDACSLPATMSSIDEYATNPRFIELQEELRLVLFTGVASLAPSRSTSPTPSEQLIGFAPDFLRQSFDFTSLSIPKTRLANYLRNWITECAPYLDKFDEERHFGVHVPIVAQTSPSLFCAVLAFSARQMERKNGQAEYIDSLELYQESIRHLAPSLQAKEPNVLVTVCILACLELMSVSPRDWRRHIEGCTALFDCFRVNGFSGGLLQAVFWCYARMELCGALISNCTESMVLHIDKWTPEILMSSSRSREEKYFVIREMFLNKSRFLPDMHANWAVYLCAKVSHLMCRRTRFLELGEPDRYDERVFIAQWIALWDELCCWIKHRPLAMSPIKTTGINSMQLFPEILFVHWAAISGNQLYHTACLLMLELKPPNHLLQPVMPQHSSIWHARRICGISLSNPHSGNLINAIQPLYLAGRLLSHRSEHIAVARLFKIIDTTTGWGALWRLRDLERVWGYDAGEISSII